MALTLALLLFSTSFFFQYRDPMLFIMGMRAFYLWLVLGIVHVLRHGIPVRIIREEREPEPPHPHER